jgi:SAM-dependent methyltransferase
MRLGILAKRLVPGFESRLLARRVLNFPRDTYERVMHKRDPLIPPHGLWFVGGEDNYRVVNEEFMRYFRDLGDLKPESAILDVGCGIGVMAAPLTSFLNSRGSYFGFDIVRAGIKWSQKNISARFPNFTFHHVDVYNKHYNPRGVLSPDSFRFPCPDESFDFVFLKSVFTHLLPDSIRHYLSEIRRVIKPTGRCLVTMFLLNDESSDLITRGRSSIPLLHQWQGCKVTDPLYPETAIGVFEKDVPTWLSNAQLRLSSPVHYGSWCGRQSYLSYQDVLVLARE